MSEANEAESQPAEAVVEESTETAAPAAAPETDPNVTANGEKLDRQTRNWRALERDRDHWREMAMRQQPQPKAPEPKQEQGPRKTLADYNFDESLYEADRSRDWERRAEEAAERKIREREERQAEQARKAKFAERQTAFAKETKDYHEVISNPAFGQSDALRDEILESDEGPAIAYYLANNLEIANRLNALPQVAVAREVARIEARLIAERAKAKEAKNQLPATPPAPKIEGSGSGSGAPIDLGSEESNKLSADEWMRRREQKLRNRK